ncbi:hypothetical protein SCHPADRAFT_821952 [Schizopora paradoxa]|uniref:Uncharacterized protein n=1 Tax=Schizopora paradoxa TaxID=27342 RepID=A0A0H2RZH2_9AGAM|nr:hypothetical protein SCHPADRAFT_821952 [Schizopora paradoxa]
MEVEEVAEIVNEVAISPVVAPELDDEEDELDDEDNRAFDDETEKVSVAQIWPQLTPRAAEKYRKEIDLIRATFQDDVDSNDMTMVHEYAEEIFEYMHKLEVDLMPNPDYMEGQNEIDNSMRQTLVDWLLQVHLRYHLLPETLWIAINIVDRFLSKRIVSVVKLQLVGVTALFIASKYEEILAPAVDEFVFVTDNGYSREEILKGEKIMLATLDFQISGYCSPYSWMRKISKADDYDIQTRTLCKYLVEVTLLDHRFLRVKPSLVAAVGMYTARQMLGGDWNEAFVFYSGYTEDHLIHGHRLIIEKLQERGFDKLGVSKKYANKKFLKASTYAVTWARHQVNTSVDSDGEDMFMED